MNKTKANFQLSTDQKSVLIGTLLGDGSLQKRGRYHRLHIKHSRVQIPLVKYKRKYFANITSMPIRLFDQKINDKTYQFCEFVTLTHPEFSKFYQYFYPDKEKVITQEIINQINNPLCLAIWFMDDGCAEYAGCSFSTHCFSRLEVELLSKTLNKKFHLKTNLRKNKGKWIIYIPKKKIVDFQQLIQEYMLPEFMYKLKPYSMRN